MNEQYVDHKISKYIDTLENKIACLEKLLVICELDASNYYSYYKRVVLKNHNLDQNFEPIPLDKIAD